MAKCFFWVISAGWNHEEDSFYAVEASSEGLSVQKYDSGQIIATSHDLTPKGS